MIQIGEGWIIIYMDDKLICDVIWKGIKDKTRKVLKILKENDLYLKPEKCVFEATCKGTFQSPFLATFALPQVLLTELT